MNSVSKQSFAKSRFRKLAASMLIFAYLFGGLLHGLCDLDVTNPAASIEASVSDSKGMNSSAKGVIADHHCHGCFSVSVPTPSLVSALIAPSISIDPPKPWFGSGKTLAIDTPPPKILT